MARLIIYPVLGLLTGVLIGAGLFDVKGAFYGAVVGATVGCAIAGYMNKAGVLDRPFFVEQDVDRLLWSLPYTLSGLPRAIRDWVILRMRSILESWVR